MISNKSNKSYHGGERARRFNQIQKAMGEYYKEHIVALQNLLRQKGVSDAEIAKAMGVSRQLVSWSKTYKKEGENK